MRARPWRGRGELGSRQLEAAELGFAQLLRRKGFSHEFRERHGADLLAQARLEYARHLAAGERIDNPVGWIIHCAWRRTQNALEQESHAPRHVPIGGGGPELAVETATPEAEALEAERRRRLQAAVAELSGEELKVIALTYFEGMSVREASRALGWDKCKGDRRHHAALQRLRELLGAADVEALQIEIGIAAFAAIAGRRAGPAGSVADALSRAAAELAARAQELARRALTGGAAEPGVGRAAGIAARTAGLCGAAALACLASGAIGPGLPGLALLGHRPAPAPPARHRAAPTAARAAPEAAAEPLPPPAAASAPTAAPKRSAGPRKASAEKASGYRAAGAAASPSAASGAQVEEEFTPFAGEAASAEPSEPVKSAPSASDASGGGAGSAPKASGAQVESEFGL